MKTLFGAAFALVVLVTGAACALAAVGIAEITSANGKVLVNRGNGFESFNENSSTVLNPGDQVMVGEGGSAHIVYVETGCEVPVAVGSTLTISNLATCMVDKGTSTSAMTAADKGPSAVPLIIGVGVVAGGIAAVLLLTGGSNDPPVSGP